jgi:hypothetical protein
LLEDGLFVVKVGHAIVDLMEFIVLVDEDGLFFDPFAVELVTSIF